MSYSSVINLMFKACDKAATIAIRDFGELENLQVSRKGTHDFVTNADIKIEKRVIKELKNAYPDFWFLVEEQGTIESEVSLKQAGYRWTVDPIDGTHNFMHGNPYFCTSIALEQINKDGSSEVVAAVTHAPIFRETYWAEKGKGAYVINDFGQEKKLRVSQRDAFPTLMYTTNSLFKNSEAQKNLLKKLVHNHAKLRISGATALDLAHVASGSLDLFFQITPTLWDTAAGKLFIKEAGGVASTLKINDSGKSKEIIVASNRKIYDKVSHILISNQSINT